MTYRVLLKPGLLLVKRGKGCRDSNMKNYRVDWHDSKKKGVCSRVRTKREQGLYIWSRLKRFYHGVGGKEENSGSLRSQKCSGDGEEWVWCVDSGMLDDVRGYDLLVKCEQKDTGIVLGRWERSFGGREWWLGQPLVDMRTTGEEGV